MVAGPAQPNGVRGMSGHLKDGQWHEGWYDTGKTGRVRAHQLEVPQPDHRRRLERLPCRTRALPPGRVARLHVASARKQSGPDQQIPSGTAAVPRRKSGCTGALDTSEPITN